MRLMGLQLFEITAIFQKWSMQKVCTTAVFSLSDLYSDSYIEISVAAILEIVKKNSH